MSAGRTCIRRENRLAQSLKDPCNHVLLGCVRTTIHLLQMERGQGRVRARAKAGSLDCSCLSPHPPSLFLHLLLLCGILNTLTPTSKPLLDTLPLIALALLNYVPS